MTVPGVTGIPIKRSDPKTDSDEIVTVCTLFPSGGLVKSKSAGANV
jgi:hypothetical protein